jgi:hypothetical protein
MSIRIDIVRQAIPVIVLRFAPIILIILVIEIGNAVAIIILRIYRAIAIVVAAVIVIIPVVHAIAISIALCQRVSSTDIIQYPWLIEHTVIVEVVLRCFIAAHMQRDMAQVDPVTAAEHQASLDFA